MSGRKGKVAKEKREAEMRLKVHVAEHLSQGEYRALSIKGEKEYKDPHYKAIVMKEALKKFLEAYPEHAPMDVDALGAVWDRVKTAYTRERKRLADRSFSGASGKDLEPKLPFYETVTWLDDHIAKRRTSTTLSGGSESLDAGAAEDHSVGDEESMAEDEDGTAGDEGDTLELELDAPIHFDASETTTKVVVVTDLTSTSLFPPGPAARDTPEATPGPSPVASTSKAGPSSTPTPDTPTSGHNRLAAQLPVLTPHNSKQKTVHASRSKSKREAELNGQFVSIMNSLKDSIASRGESAAPPRGITPSSEEMLVGVAIGKALEEVKDRHLRKTWKRKFEDLKDDLLDLLNEKENEGNS